MQRKNRLVLEVKDQAPKRSNQINQINQIKNFIIVSEIFSLQAAN